jgi:hypothetical protein
VNVGSDGDDLGRIRTWVQLNDAKRMLHGKPNRWPGRAVSQR